MFRSGSSLICSLAETMNQDIEPTEHRSPKPPFETEAPLPDRENGAGNADAKRAERSDSRANVVPESGKAGELSTGDGEEMNILDHLEEIRWRLIKAAMIFLAATVCAGMFADTLVNEVLLGPLRWSGDAVNLQNLVPYGQITLYLQTVFFTGFVLSFPFLVLQIWKFVEPGLHENEKKASRFIILFVSLCFFAGVAFGYFVFLPVSLMFFAGFGTPLIKNNIAIQHYVSFVMGTMLTSGLVFELPFISYILSRIGLLTPAFMRYYRKHAIVLLLIVAAVVTPSTDMVTQLVIGLPMILLYEISIWISGYVNRKNNALKHP